MNCSNSIEHMKVLFKIRTYLILTKYNIKQHLNNKISIIAITANHSSFKQHTSKTIWYQTFKRHIPNRIYWNNCPHTTLQKLPLWVQDHITKEHKIHILYLLSNSLVHAQSKVTARIDYILNISSLKIVDVGNNLFKYNQRQTYLRQTRTNCNNLQALIERDLWRKKCQGNGFLRPRRRIISDPLSNLNNQIKSRLIYKVQRHQDGDKNLLWNVTLLRLRILVVPKNT